MSNNYADMIGQKFIITRGPRRGYIGELIEVRKLNYGLYDAVLKVDLDDDKNTDNTYITIPTEDLKIPLVASISIGDDFSNVVENLFDNESVIESLTHIITDMISKPGHEVRVDIYFPNIYIEDLHFKINDLTETQTVLASIKLAIDAAISSNSNYIHIHVYEQHKPLKVYISQNMTDLTDESIKSTRRAAISLIEAKLGSIKVIDNYHIHHDTTLTSDRAWHIERAIQHISKADAIYFCDQDNPSAIVMIEKAVADLCNMRKLNDEL